MATIKWPQKKDIKLGDLFAKVTKALKVKPCPSCRLRQAALNTVDFSFPTGKFISAIVCATLDPERVLWEQELNKQYGNIQHARIMRTAERKGNSSFWSDAYSAEPVGDRLGESVHWLGIERKEVASIEDDGIKLKDELIATEQAVEIRKKALSSVLSKAFFTRVKEARERLASLPDVDERLASAGMARGARLEENVRIPISPVCLTKITGE